MSTSPVETTIDPSLIELVLEPYKPHCRYLVKAVATSDPGAAETIFEAEATFCIPESCYIKSTGHFNSVEFNLCYNQIAYCSLAHAIQNHWLAGFCDWTLEQFIQRQLSHCLIIEFSSRFRQPLNPQQLTGKFKVHKMRELIAGILILETTCEYTDSFGAAASGAVKFAIQLSRDAVRESKF
jgi:hypothetical protein